MEYVCILVIAIVFLNLFIVCSICRGMGSIEECALLEKRLERETEIHNEEILILKNMKIRGINIEKETKREMERYKESLKKLIVTYGNSVYIMMKKDK